MKTIKQIEITGDWTDEDEAHLRLLVSKRKKAGRGGKSADLKFVEDLLIGEDAENSIVKAFQSGEVKRDFGVGKTKRVFVEHESFQRPSGIVTTEADYFIFVLDGEEFNSEVFIGISTDRLKDILSGITWETRGGDMKASKGKLVRLAQLLATKTIIKNRKERSGVGKDKEGTTS